MAQRKVDFKGRKVILRVYFLSNFSIPLSLPSCAASEHGGRFEIQNSIFNLKTSLPTAILFVCSQLNVTLNESSTFSLELRAEFFYIPSQSSSSSCIYSDIVPLVTC